MDLERKPFDPADPVDAMAESFRRQVCDIMLDADKAAIFRNMDGHSKLQCFMSGTITGVVGVCMAFVEPEGHDDLLATIAAYLPQARANVRDIMDEGDA